MKLNILLVDDNKTVRDMFCKQLQQWGYNTVEAASGKEAMQKLMQLADTERRPNIALLDWHMPEMDGIALCKWIKDYAAYKRGPHLYVVFLTVDKGSDRETTAFKAGAEGYVVKGSWEELEAKLTSVKGRILEEYDLRNTIANLQQDPSGVLVKREIIDRLGRRATQVDQSPLGIVLLDINDFKRINDQYGHQVGDQILEAVGMRLQESVRGGNVGRYGGDEFLIGLPGCDKETTDKRAQEISARLTADPVSTSAGKIHISICYGTAANAGSVGLDDLIKTADQALYEQKSLRKKFLALSPF
jgi:two-component system cell cycle response regulator